MEMDLWRDWCTSHSTLALAVDSTLVDSSRCLGHFTTQTVHSINTSGPTMSFLLLFQHINNINIVSICWKHYVWLKTVLVHFFGALPIMLNVWYSSDWLSHTTHHCILTTRGNASTVCGCVLSYYILSIMYIQNNFPTCSCVLVIALIIFQQVHALQSWL